MKLGARAFVALLVLGAALGAACEDDETPESLVPQSPEDDQATVIELGNLQVSFNSTADVFGQDRVTVLVGGSRSVEDEGAFSFTPTFIEGTPGQRLTLEVENNSGVLHNLTVRGTTTDVDIPQGQSTEVTVTVPVDGATLFFCKYHTLAGMNGQLLAVGVAPSPVEVTPTAVPLP